MSNNIVNILERSHSFPSAIYASKSTSQDVNVLVRSALNALAVGQATRVCETALHVDCPFNPGSYHDIKLITYIADKVLFHKRFGNCNANIDALTRLIISLKDPSCPLEQKTQALQGCLFFEDLIHSVEPFFKGENAKERVLQNPSVLLSICTEQGLSILDHWYNVFLLKTPIESMIDTLKTVESTMQKKELLFQKELLALCKNEEQKSLMLDLFFPEKPKTKCRDCFLNQEKTLAMTQSYLSSLEEYAIRQLPSSPLFFKGCVVNDETSLSLNAANEKLYDLLADGFVHRFIDAGRDRFIEGFFTHLFAFLRCSLDPAINEKIIAKLLYSKEVRTELNKSRDSQSFIKTLIGESKNPYPLLLSIAEQKEVPCSWTLNYIINDDRLTKEQKIDIICKLLSHLWFSETAFFSSYFFRYFFLALSDEEKLQILKSWKLIGKFCIENLELLAISSPKLLRELFIHEISSFVSFDWFPHLSKIGVQSDQDKLAFIREVAPLNGYTIAEHLPKFQITDPEILKELALSCSLSKLGPGPYIEHFGLLPHEILEIMAQRAADHAPVDLAENIHKYKIEREEIRLELAMKAFQIEPISQLESDLLDNYCLSEENQVKVLLVNAEQVKKEILQDPRNYETFLICLAKLKLAAYENFNILYAVFKNFKDLNLGRWQKEYTMSLIDSDISFITLFKEASILIKQDSSLLLQFIESKIFPTFIQEAPPLLSKKIEGNFEAFKKGNEGLDVQLSKKLYLYTAAKLPEKQDLLWDVLTPQQKMNIFYLHLIQLASPSLNFSNAEMDTIKEVIVKIRDPIFALQIFKIVAERSWQKRVCSSLGQSFSDPFEVLLTIQMPGKSKAVACDFFRLPMLLISQWAKVEDKLLIGTIQKLAQSTRDFYKQENQYRQIWQSLLLSLEDSSYTFGERMEILSLLCSDPKLASQGITKELSKEDKASIAKDFVEKSRCAASLIKSNPGIFKKKDFKEDTLEKLKKEVLDTIINDDYYGIDSKNIPIETFISTIGACRQAGAWDIFKNKLKSLDNTEVRQAFQNIIGSILSDSYQAWMKIPRGAHLAALSTKFPQVWEAYLEKPEEKIIILDSSISSQDGSIFTFEQWLLSKMGDGHLLEDGRDPLFPELAHFLQQQTVEKNKALIQRQQALSEAPPAPLQEVEELLMRLCIKVTTTDNLVAQLKVLHDKAKNLPSCEFFDNDVPGLIRTLSKTETNTTFKIKVLSDPNDKLLIGREVDGSCLRYDGHPARACCLLAILGDPKNEVIAVVDPITSQIKARATFHLLIEKDAQDPDFARPALYMEPLYPYPLTNIMMEKAIIEYAQKRAKNLGIPLYMQSGKIYDSFATIVSCPENGKYLFSDRSDFPFEYVDNARQGSKKGGTFFITDYKAL